MHSTKLVPAPLSSLFTILKKRIILQSQLIQLVFHSKDHGSYLYPTTLFGGLIFQSAAFFLCYRIEKSLMRHFLAPSGQPEMMREKLHALLLSLRFFPAELRMKFYILCPP